MCALIYDEHQLDESEKKVISLHDSRSAAEAALEKRIKDLGKTMWECNTRVAWIEKDVAREDIVRPGEYDTWRDGEDIPEGETHSDTD